MIYEYNRRVLENYIKGKPRVDNEKFVGYLLPDGTPYEVINHNLKGKATYFYMILGLISLNYESKKEILSDINLTDPLDKILITYLKNISHEEASALDKFLKETSINFDDLLVGFFKCHKVSRFNQEILTSATDNRIFYNYILEKYTIKNVPRIVYDNNEFKMVDKSNLSNEYLSDEIKNIEKDANFGEEHLFYK